MTGPKKSAGDDLNTPTNAERAYGVGSFMAKATAGVLAPVGGGVLAAAFDLIVIDPAVRRRDKFLMDLNERLTEMEQAGLITARELENSDEISSLLLKAVQTATRSSGERKLEALKEVVVRGITAKEAASASQAQVMLALIDRTTEYHIIALHWHSMHHKEYTLGEKINPPDGFKESFHYGQTVQTEKAEMIEPVCIFSNGTAGLNLYVERSSQLAFEIAEADLVALGLTKLVFKSEYYFDRDGKRQKRNTENVEKTKVTELGMYLLKYIGLYEGRQKHAIG